MGNERIKQEKILGHNKRISILGAPIDVLNTKQTIHLVEQYILKKEPLHLLGVNADKLTQIHKDVRLRKIVKSCGVINADGASLIMASKFLSKPLPERVAGIDLMQALIALCEKKQYSVYLLGAKQHVVEQTAKALKNRHPHLKLLGTHHGYFKKEDWSTISDKLKKIKPDITFVGITSPLKEYLVEYLQNDGNKGVFMGVGGSFDVLSGNIPRAPLWMQHMNLEWLFRISLEPRKRLKRCLVSNTFFIGAVLREKFSKKSLGN